MTFAVVNSTAEMSREDCGLIINSSKAISVDIRCSGELLVKFINLFQKSDLPRAEHMFTCQTKDPSSLIGKISFVAPKNISDFFRENFSTLIEGSQHVFVFQHNDEVRVVRVTIQETGILIEDLESSTDQNEMVTMYSSRQITQ
jgi:hypothetical protein